MSGIGRATHLGQPGGDRISISALDPDPCELVPIMGELGLHRGVLVASTYRIVRPLGVGGMGVVVLAHDERLDRDVAIKLVRPELFAQASHRELFAIEARAMARISHPNVLAVHTSGEHEGIPYFVMEYVEEGRTVEQWVAESGGALDLDKAARILEQTCFGVEAIHASDTIHRDLKPSNLLVDVKAGALRVAVSDLGVARILARPAGEDGYALVGSAAYMAPEAALGDDTRPELATRRDVYALGCIAYEVLAGRPPFLAPTDTALVAKHLLEAPPRPTAFRADLPAGYDEVLMRALHKDPAERWPSVAAFRRALARAHTNEAVPERILIADDDDDWCDLMVRALKDRFPDARFDVVRDGESAKLAFEQHPYSVVLVDLEMPEIDGMQLTAHLRSLEASARTPIIVLTAAGGPGEWRRLSELGADGFLVKPVDAEDVAALMRRTMKARQHRPT